MMFRFFVFTSVVYLASIFQHGDGYRILCLFPAPSVSHQVVYRGLSLALNKRGHELVIVTTDPVNDPNLVNYTEIDISVVYDTIAHLKFITTRPEMKWIDWNKELDSHLFHLVDRVLGHPDLKKLYASNSNEKFDLLIVEMMYWQGAYPLATRFNVPMIGISSFALGVNVHYSIGNPIMPCHPSTWQLEADSSNQSSFWQRLRNFITIWKYLYWYQNSYIAGQEAIAKKHFGDDIPNLTDLEKNVSLIFVNERTPISYTRPHIPKIIEIGGFHISNKIIPLPEDLQKFLDEAMEGFVYVSLGTNVPSASMPRKTRNEFVAAFSRLPYKVLWKFDDDILPGKPDNVRIMKWVPQQAVLAHPNLKVFVYQGGLQSTEEAVHHAVPLVGLPVLFDQDMHVNKMVSLGVAKKLEITAIYANELCEAINTVASDTSYKWRMLNLRSLMNDKPHDLLENAVWWTEHVIRHRGAPHLHSNTGDDPWYRRQDMDIVAFITTGIVMAVNLTIFILYQWIKNIRNIFGARSLHMKKIN